MPAEITSKEGAKESPAAEGSPRTFTQDRVDEIVRERLAKEKAKYADFEKYKADSVKLAEAERDAEAARADRDALSAELDAIKAERDRAELVAAKAAEAGVDAALLARMSGESAEEVADNAAALKRGIDDARAYPQVADRGETAPATVSKSDISAIKDPRERVLARARNRELYAS